MIEAHDTIATQKSRPPAFLVTNKAISSGATKGVCDVTLPSSIVFGLREDRYVFAAAILADCQEVLI